MLILTTPLLRLNTCMLLLNCSLSIQNFSTTLHVASWDTIGFSAYIKQHFKIYNLYILLSVKIIHYEHMIYHVFAGCFLGCSFFFKGKKNMAKRDLNFKSLHQKHQNISFDIKKKKKNKKKKKKKTNKQTNIGGYSLICL